MDIVGAIASEKTKTPKPLSPDKPRVKYVVHVDPIDGSSNLELGRGAATTGTIRIMDIAPQVIHQRMPFAVGSRDKIDLYESYYKNA